MKKRANSWVYVVSFEEEEAGRNEVLRKNIRNVIWGYEDIKKKACTRINKTV